MIERLRTTLLALAARPATAPTDDAVAHVVADCADALRLQLDCPQQELTPRERAALHDLREVLDEEHASAAAVQRAAGRAAAALGLEAGAPPAR
jgi:hypothetical protein